MPDVLTRKGARNFTETVDRVASAVQTKHGLLGIPQDVASDFAIRCDLISDAAELTAASNDPLATDDEEAPDEEKASKKATPEWPLQPGKNETGDSVEPAGSADPHWNANAIGDQRPGPFKSDADEAFMAGEFTQQEFQELRDKQQAGQLPGVDAKLASDFRALSTDIDDTTKTAKEFPELQGFAGFTEHIRRLDEVGTELEQVKAEIEAQTAELQRRKKDLDKEYDAAVKKLKKAVPEELDYQGRIIMSRKTALVEASAIMQVKRTKRTLNQVQAELLVSVAEQYSDEVAKFIKVTSATLRDEKKKMSVVLEGFNLEDRTMSASDKTAGLLDALNKFRMWLVGGIDKLVGFFSTATRIFKGSGKNVEKAHGQFMKVLKATEKMGSTESNDGFNLTN